MNREALAMFAGIAVCVAVGTAAGAGLGVSIFVQVAGVAVTAAAYTAGLVVSRTHRLNRHRRYPW